MAPTFSRAFLYASVLAGSLWLPGAVAADDDDIAYSPCPLIRAYYPPPTISSSSDTVASFVKDFTAEFDKLIQAGGSDDYGSITPNTTSFSVVLFSGTADGSDPVFFEYHHTASAALAENATNVTADTVFPVGDLTQLFTVYTWLLEAGDEVWETPITEFLSELSDNATASGDDATVPWEDVTIGTLAAQMSGLARDSFACTLNKPCDWDAFRTKFASVPPVFLPGTTPVVSNAAFQLLAFALEKKNGQKFTEVFSSTTLEPLNMTNSGLLGCNSAQVFGRQDLNASQVGEPASLSLLSTTGDLARAGNAMLSSRLLAPAVTRRWLHPVADTSNLRNGVGRPWEIYRAGSSSISPIVDVFTKSGAVGQFASYFGLAPDFNAGFAILAHDSTAADRKLDLNVYADVVSDGLTQLTEMAAMQMVLQFVGEYASADNQSVVAFNQSDYGPGLSVVTAQLDGVDLRAKVAYAMGIEEASNLDFRLYPTNVASASSRQFVAVFQDKAAPVDMGTPTCITWQDVGSLGQGVPSRFVFDLDSTTGEATGVRIQGAATLSKAA